MSKKKRVSFIRRILNNRKNAAIFAVVFAFLGIIVLLRSQAAGPSVSVEAETGVLSECASIADDTLASNAKAIQFGAVSVCSPSGFVHPGVVFTKAEIDAWSTSSPEYSRLAGTCAGNVNPTSGSCVTRSAPVVYGTIIESGSDIHDDTSEMNRGFKDQSGFAKVQAVLWAADNNNDRRDKAISYLNEYRTVTSFQWDSVEQYRLVAGWSCTNLAQAAEIINYQDTQFKRFMKDVCYPALSWSAGANWHASFADSKLAIAAYLGDAELWTDAKRYFYERLKQSVYHSKYDSNKINPIHSEDLSTLVKDGSGVSIGSNSPARIHTTAGTSHLSTSKTHWGVAFGGQINDDYTLKTSLPIVDGMNAERLRDLAHVNMSFAAWVNGARTIRAQGEQLEQQAYDRILAGWGYHAGRALAYLQTGTIPTPTPATNEGGEQFKQGYYGAKSFFGANTPSSITNMLQRSEVTTFTASGTLHIVGEAFTDGR